MRKIEFFQIDAFTDKVFYGNPAVICFVQTWLNDELLQAIALENNLSETAFIMEENGNFQIRWFTPRGEINLSGHSTLAAAFILFELNKVSNDTVNFSSLGGEITVRKKGDLLTMNFPRIEVTPLNTHSHLSNLINQPFNEAFESDLDYLIVLECESQVMNTSIDLKAVEKLSKRGLIITSKGQNTDFYSRCFYPKYNIPEDPVTGSAHCVLAPFWAARLDKTKLRGKQGLLRQGEVLCEVLQERILISGHCKWYSRGYLVI